ncbi:MAG: hypothetical protein AAGB11_10805 [Pseudomonadota bacterium]
MRVSGRFLLSTTSLTGLLLLAGPFLGAPLVTPAHASCDFTSDDGAPNTLVDCPEGYENTIVEYVEDVNEGGSIDTELTLERSADEFFERRNTDLSGNDQLTGVSNGSAEDFLFLSTRFSPESGTDEVFDVLDLREGNDVVDLSGGTVFGTLLTGEGNDTVTLTGVTTSFVETDDGAREETFVRDNGDVVDVAGVALNLLEGNDVVSVAGGTIGGTINGGEGNDTLTVDALVVGSDEETATIAGDLLGEAGNDVITISGATVAGQVAGGAGNDSISLSRGSASEISGGEGNDAITVSSGGSTARILGDGGNDTVRISGLVDGLGIQSGNVAVSGQDGNDTIAVQNGGVVRDRILGGLGNDTIVVAQGGEVSNVTNDVDQNVINGANGDDVITVGGSVLAIRNTRDAILGGADASDGGGSEDVSGNDTIRILSTGVVVGGINGDAGNDTIESAGSVDGYILAGAGNDVVTVSGGSISGPGDRAGVDLGAGNDVLVASGGEIGGGILGGADNDRVTISGASVAGGIDGGSGDDAITISAGSVDGTIANFETVTISGSGNGSGGSSITGTLIIDGATDTVAAAGGVAGATIQAATTSASRTDVTVRNSQGFTAPGTGSSLELRGVKNFNVVNSDLSLTGSQFLERARFTNGSSVTISGNTSFITASGDFADLDVTGSTLNLLDGDTDDTLEIGDLNLRRSTVAFDVDPMAGINDLIRVTGSLRNFSGNTLQINFLSDPDVALQQTIPLVDLGNADPDLAVSPGDNAFVLAFSPTTLQNLAILQSPDGSLFVRTNNDGGAILDPTPVALHSASLFIVDTVGDVTTELADGAIGFEGRPGATRTEISPTFGVFSSGQAGRDYHDGFSVSGGAIRNQSTPSFSASDFSLVGTGELDASAQFDLEDIGLRFAGFGGYVRSFVELDRAVPGGGFSPFKGDGLNQGGVFGGSVLVSKVQGLGNLNYGLLAAAGFLGVTDVTLPGNGATGDYGTKGFTISAKAGRNIAVSDNVRLDVRFGAAFSAFEGDSFTSSAGDRFGKTNTHIGVVSFEPGVSTAVAVGDYVVSPFGRLLFQGRLAYSNEADFGTATLNFDDDGDFTMGAQLGMSASLTDQLSAGISVEGRASQAERSILGKLSVNYLIPRS